MFDQFFEFCFVIKARFFTPIIDAVLAITDTCTPYKPIPLQRSTLICVSVFSIQSKKVFLPIVKVFDFHM
jgi:hypothetical protein